MIKYHPDTVLIVARGVRVLLRETGLSATRVIIEMSPDNFTRLKLATSVDKLNKYGPHECEVDNTVFRAVDE